MIIKLKIIANKLRRCFCIKKEVILNERIREKEIRLVWQDGSKVVQTKEALYQANKEGLDLVVISPSAVPPVCKIMDYNKFLYEQSKKEKEVKKNQKIVEVKEIRLSPNIEEHDILIKANNARKFLLNGDKVKVSIRFRGRQNNYTHLGTGVFDKFIEKIDGVGVIEKAPKLEGNNMIMILAPQLNKVKQ